MKGLIIISIVLILLAFVGDHLVRKKITITSENNKSKRIKVVEGIVIFLLFVGYLITSLILNIKYGSLHVLYLIVPFFYAVSLFRTFMEWQFNRSANRWVSELYSVFTMTLLFIAIQWSGILA